MEAALGLDCRRKKEWAELSEGQVFFIAVIVDNMEEQPASASLVRDDLAGKIPPRGSKKLPNNAADDRASVGRWRSISRSLRGEGVLLAYLKVVIVRAVVNEAHGLVAGLTAAPLETKRPGPAWRGCVHKHLPARAPREG